MSQNFLTRYVNKKLTVKEKTLKPVEVPEVSVGLR